MSQPTQHKFKYIQIAILVFIWILLFSIPMLLGDNTNGFDWQHILRVWRETAILFLVFLINHFILIPYLFFKGRRIAYFASAIVLIGMLVFGLFLFKPKKENEARPGIPPMEQSFRDDSPIQANAPHFRPPQHNYLRPPKGIPPYANFFILSILLIGFDTGLSISMKWLELEQNRISIEKENTQNQLTFLRNQISPHFFMNTLNNIHALVDYNSEQAQDAIIKLSHMMSYMLYESEGKQIPIKKEVQFINSYIELMELRFTDKVKVDFKIPDKIPDISVPSLLFISFIENAFKYGISYQKPSNIHINIAFNENNLDFKIENSVHKKNEEKENSGLGIANTRKRLDLIYGKNYSLDILQEKESFFVHLNIPL